MGQAEEIIVRISPFPQRLESACGGVLRGVCPFACNNIHDNVDDGVSACFVIVAESSVGLAVRVVIEYVILTYFRSYGVAVLSVLSIEERSVGILSFTADIEQIQSAGHIVVSRIKSAVGYVKVTLADPLVGLRIVIEHHEFPVVVPVADQDYVRNVLVILKFEFELQHLFGIDHDDRTCSLREDACDIVGVRLAAVGEVGLKRTDKFGDVNRFGRLDQLEGAGGVEEGDNVASDSVALGGNLKLVSVYRGFVLGENVQGVGNVLACVLVGCYGIADRCVLGAVVLHAGDGNGDVLVGRCGIAGNSDFRFRYGGGSKEGKLRGGKLKLAQRLVEIGSLVTELNLGAHILERFVGAVEIRREAQLAFRFAVSQVKAVVVARISLVVKVKALGSERVCDELEVVGEMEIQSVHLDILFLPVVADIILHGKVNESVIHADAAR